MARIKGSSMIDLVKMLRTQPDKARQLLPESMHHYLETRIAPFQWYPEKDLIQLVRAGVKLLPPDAGDPLELMGRVVAKNHLGGDYSHLQAEGDIFHISRKSFALWGTMQDSGKLIVKSEGDHSAVVQLADFDEPSLEMCGIVRGYIASVFEGAGLSEVVVAEVACCLKGDETCLWKVTWVD